MIEVSKVHYDVIAITEKKVQLNITQAVEGLGWGEEEDDKPKTPILLVMDEVLSDTDRAISYHKYWMDSNWYRFSLERGR